MAAKPYGSSGPWLLKVCFSGYTGKHSSEPLQVDDVVILNLGLPPETDPPNHQRTPGAGSAQKVATAFLTEDEAPCPDGLDVDLEAYRLTHADGSWRIVRADSPDE